MVKEMQKPSRPLCSFDVARIAAMSLIAMCHLFSVPDGQGLTIPGGLNMGQLGVTIFCGLSGYFSMRSTYDSNAGWIVSRLKRVFVPYWISLVAIFTANAVTHYKPVTVGLLASEFLGTGMFTHPQSLVGVYTWFISLILICYAFALLLRWNRGALLLLVPLAVLLAYWNPLVSTHLLSFQCGCLLSNKRGVTNRCAAVGLSLCCIAGIVMQNMTFAYPLAATLVVQTCAFASRPGSHTLRVIADSTYEFYLVHGPIYLGLAKYLELGVLTNAFAGTLLAVMATFLLRKVSTTALAFGAACQEYWSKSEPNRDRVSPLDHGEVDPDPLTKGEYGAIAPDPR